MLCIALKKKKNAILSNFTQDLSLAGKIKARCKTLNCKVPRGGCYSYAAHGKWITHAGVLSAI